MKNVDTFNMKHKTQSHPLRCGIQSLFLTHLKTPLDSDPWLHIKIYVLSTKKCHKIINKVVTL